MDKVVTAGDSHYFPDDTMVTHNTHKATSSKIRTEYASGKIEIPSTREPFSKAINTSHKRTKDDSHKPPLTISSPTTSARPKLVARRPKNEQRLTKIGKKAFIIFKASNCGHEIHPGTGQHTHEPDCPPCKMEILCADLTQHQEKFHKRGGIVISSGKSVKRSASELEDEEATEQEEKEEKSRKRGKRDEHHLLLRGWVNKPEMKRKRAMGDDLEATGWRRAKTNLINFVDRCDEKAAQEVRWEWENMKWKQGEGYPGTKSHRDAMSVYAEQENGLRYVPGDPVGEQNRDYKALVRRQDKVVRARFEMPWTKKRRLGDCVHVRFNEIVTVFAHHDIDAVRFAMQPQVFREPPPQPAPSTLPLKGPGDAKNNAAYWRRAMKTVRGKKTRVTNSRYRPGAWVSPPGYEKAETSWLHETDEQREKDSQLDVHTLENLGLVDSCKAAFAGIRAAMALPGF